MTKKTFDTAINFDLGGWDYSKRNSLNKPVKATQEIIKHQQEYRPGASK